MWHLQLATGNFIGRRQTAHDEVLQSRRLLGCVGDMLKLLQFFLTRTITAEAHDGQPVSGDREDRLNALSELSQH